MVQDVPKISIIIPIFNAAQNLSKTLESICEQNYTNLEIILVDDGSTDDSGNICEKWAVIDERIQVYHKENGGVAEARNYGLKRMSGDYVMFIDADDLAKQEYIEKMVDAAERTDALLVVCKHMSGACNSPDDFLAFKPSDTPKVTIVKLNDYRWTGKYHHTTCWGALYSASLIKDLYFEKDLMVGEDTLFFAMAMKNTNAFTFVDEQYYYYRYTPESIVRSNFKAKHFDEIIAWERVAKLYADQSQAFTNECEVAIAQRARKLWIRAFLSKFPDKGLLKGVYKKAFGRWRNVLQSKDISIKDKLVFFTFIVIPHLHAGIKA